MTRSQMEPRTELGFELESFEWKAPDRLEVSGRWFGVRGRRFVRPLLTLRADGRRRRLIAVLDHKPWAADGEGPWIAAFAWRGERGKITNARLEVAPDVVLELPAPGEDAGGALLYPRPPKRETTPAAKAAAPPPADAAPAPPADGAPAPPADAAPAPPADAAPAAAASPPAQTPPGTAAPSPPAAAPAPSPPADVVPAAALADAERQLGEERAARERLEAALSDAEARFAALSEHQDAAVERANELVRLEGELAAAREHIERVERDRVTAQQRGDDAERRVAAFRERAETAERELAAAGDRADGAKRHAAERASAAERDAAAAGQRADAAEREAAAARERPAPPAADDVAALRRRAEAAERELAAARERPAPPDELRRRVASAEFDLAAAQDRAEAAEAEAASLRRRAETGDHARAVPDSVLAARGVPPKQERGWAARAIGLVWIAVLLIVLVVIVSLVL